MDWTSQVHQIFAERVSPAALGRCGDGVRLELSEEGAQAVSQTVNAVLGMLVVECSRCSALLNMCGPPEVRTAIRLLFVGEACARALKAACAALTRLLHKPSHISSATPLACSRSAQCGLAFPVGRLQRLLIEQGVACRVDLAAAVTLAAVLDFLCLELLRHAVDVSLAHTSCSFIDPHSGSPLRSPPRGFRRSLSAEAAATAVDVASMSLLSTSAPVAAEMGRGASAGVSESGGFRVGDIKGVGKTDGGPEDSFLGGVGDFGDDEGEGEGVCLESSRPIALSPLPRIVVVDHAHVERACAADEALFPLSRRAPTQAPEGPDGFSAGPSPYSTSPASSAALRKMKLAIDACITVLNVSDRSVVWEEDAVMNLFYYLRLAALRSAPSGISRRPSAGPFGGAPERAPDAGTRGGSHVHGGVGTSAGGGSSGTGVVGDGGEGSSRGAAQGAATPAASVGGAAPSARAGAPGAISPPFGRFSQRESLEPAGDGLMALTELRSPRYSYFGLTTLQSLVRASLIFAEHMGRGVIRSDDVVDAARVLRMGDVPARWGVPCVWHSVVGAVCLDKESLVVNACFQALQSGRADVVPIIMETLRQHHLSIDVREPHGLTMLMCACMRGDAATARALIAHGADVNSALLPSAQLSSVWERMRGFTALHFAVLFRHVHVVRTLLQLSASPEGQSAQLLQTHIHFPPHLFESNVMMRCHYVLSPLHLAAWAGDAAIVGELLSVGAHPYRTASGVAGGSNAFVLAATGGHFPVIKLLLQHGPPVHPSQLLSLQEILAEGASAAAEPAAGEAGGLSPAQRSDLAETLYTCVENGFLAMALELRTLGVRWSLFSWTHALCQAWDHADGVAMAALVDDFVRARYEDFEVDFATLGLPLLFRIARNNPMSALSLSCLHAISLVWTILAPFAVPATHPVVVPPMPAMDGIRVGREFVNAQELSDVVFMVEDQPFYAHKIVLVTASERFRQMLTGHFVESRMKTIPIPDIPYAVFRLVMDYLYTGHGDCLTDQPRDMIVAVLAAADFYLLESLRRECEDLLAHTLDGDNAMDTFVCAQRYNASVLAAACDEFFLTHLSALRPDSPLGMMLFDNELPLLERLEQRLCAALSAHLKLAPNDGLHGAAGGSAGGNGARSPPLSFSRTGSGTNAFARAGSGGDAAAGFAEGEAGAAMGFMAHGGGGGGGGGVVSREHSPTSV